MSNQNNNPELHTENSVQIVGNIPSQATVAGLTNCQREDCLNGIELDIDSDASPSINGTNTVNQPDQHEATNPLQQEDPQHASSTQAENEVELTQPVELALPETVETIACEVVEPIHELEPDRRLEVIRRAFDFIDENSNSVEQENLLGVLLLQRKLCDVREFLLDESVADDAVTSVASDQSNTLALIEVIEHKLNTAATENCATRTLLTYPDPMGFDLFNRIRDFLLGGRSNAKDPPNTVCEDGAANRKRSNESSKQRVIKYRKVDNTFPKFMPNDTDDYNQMEDSKHEPENNSNNNAYPTQKRLSIFTAPQMRRVRVKPTSQANVAIDLSDTDEQQPNESNMYQAFADRLVNSSEPIARLQIGRPTSAITPNLLYSDALRYGTNGIGTDINCPRPSSSLSSSTGAHVNGHANKSYENNSNRENMMSLEDRRNEHNQYIQLINTLSLQEKDLPATQQSLAGRNAEKPLLPPLPPLQRINLNNDAWLKETFEYKPPASYFSERAEYAKLLESKSNSEVKENTSTDLNKIQPQSTNLLGTISDDCQQSLPIKSYDDQILDITDRSEVLIPVCRPMTQALQLRNNSSTYFAENYQETFNEKCARKQKETSYTKQMIWEEAQKSTEERRKFEQGLRENLTKRRFMSQPLLVLETFISLDKKEIEFIPFTNEHQQRYNELIHGPPQQVLVSKFGLNISRADIRTLIGSCWLNDEVINFYMSMLTDRSEQKAGKMPSVYAMNTFFVPRLLKTGHSGVKRWTRKVDLFSKDIIPVPVHVGNVHWCMAIIHMKNKTIRYYDSMGKPNQPVLNALEAYLREESFDKRKCAFDTSDFQIENVQNVPQQTNGSDCGVFSCMFAEYITRDKQLTFTQEHMDYFRKKMVLEICSGELFL